MITVAIPTIQNNMPQLHELYPFLASNRDLVELVVVRDLKSAARNRNRCLDRSSGDTMVMMDDDVFGFFPGWIDMLVSPLIDQPEKFSIISARFSSTKKRRRGKPGSRFSSMLGDGGVRGPRGTMQVALHREGSPVQMVCSACIAFRVSDGVRFDEGYDGAVFEDSDFCMQMRRKFPNRDIVINNKCVLEHRCEHKRHWEIKGGSVRGNQSRFEEKWKGVVL